LQLSQNKLRDDQRAGQETCFGDIGNAAIDDYRRIENF